MEKPYKFTNHQLADFFNKIADLLEIKGEIVYKTIAYRKAADSINEINQDISEIWASGHLTDIPGVGKAISEKIIELLSTGKLDFYEKLTQEVPESLVQLLRVPDLGPKKAAVLWRSASIVNLEDLEKAARDGQIRSLPGFGEKSEQKIISGIEALRRQSGRIPIGKAWLFCERLTDFFSPHTDILQLQFAGSFRRGRDTIGDIDLVIATENSAPVMKAFVNHPDVIRVIGHGEEKSSVEFSQGVRVQLWCSQPDRYGTTLQYATGSKEHNVRLREIAKAMGYSLSEHSLQRENGEEILCASEPAVYKSLGLPWIPPEIREDRGELQAAKNGTLPDLLQVEDIRAEFHSHTTWSDAKLSIREMAAEAIKRGIKILAITDHSRSLGVAGGLSIEALAAQKLEIETVRQELGESLILLQGSEVEILADGSLDYPDEVLKRLDVVIASLHTGLRQPKEKITERLIRAVKNPFIDLIGHPTGRMIPDREGADLDIQAVLAAAAEAGVALELNAHPSRLDLNDVNCRQAAGMGIPIMINTDAHSGQDFDLLHFGVGTARRAWLSKDQVVNCWDSNRFLSWLDCRKSNANKG